MVDNFICSDEEFIERNWIRTEQTGSGLSHSSHLGDFPCSSVKPFTYFLLENQMSDCDIFVWLFSQLGKKFFCCSDDLLYR